MSKLAALAAKRRQKENANPTPPSVPTSDTPQDAYTASLSKLSLTSDATKERGKKAKEEDLSSKTIAEDAHKADQGNQPPANLKNAEDEPVVARTQPSAFAGTFLNTSPFPDHRTTINPSLLVSNIQSFDFKEPSPDDIVYKAQTGRTRQ